MNNNIRKDWRGYLPENLLKKITEGDWKPLIETIVKDPELDIQIRNENINIYYRGGNLINLKTTDYNFDPHYFYNEDIKDFSKNIPIAFVEKVNKGEIILRKRKKEYVIPDKSTAERILKEIENKSQELRSLFNNKQFTEYIQMAKNAMDKWRKYNNRNERKDQHYISLSNKEFSIENNLVVIDLEFKLSTDKKHHLYNFTGKSCSFDIIAVDNTGQIYVIELKENTKADQEGKKANVDHHLKDFNSSIGRDENGDFISEIKQLIKVKCDLGILNLNNIEISNTKPIFAISYSGENEEDFYLTHPEILHIKVKNHKLIK